MMQASPQRRRSVLFVVVPVLIVLFPLAYSAISALFAQGVETADLLLERPDPEYRTCVRDTTYMRFHHWELLRETRKEVVRYGVRGDVGLHMCDECHTSRERFCDRCHAAASVVLDCFGCHYYP